MLTSRQLLTIEHLKGIGITEPLDIIQFCIEKLEKPRYGYNNRRAHKLKRSDCREHSKNHYQNIINHLAQTTK